LIGKLAVGELAKDSLADFSAICGAAFAGASYKLDSATSIARHESELLRALDINPQTNYIGEKSDKFGYCIQYPNLSDLTLELRSLSVFSNTS
jgi:hypothetical protein